MRQAAPSDKDRMTPSCSPRCSARGTLHALFRDAHYATKARAFRNSRIQPLHSPAPSGRQEFCTERVERSGCGIMMVTRPSALVTEVMPKGEPPGFEGYVVATVRSRLT